MKGVTMYFPEGNDYPNKVKKVMDYFDSMLENEDKRPYALVFDMKIFCANAELNYSTFWMILNYLEELYGYSNTVDKETIKHLLLAEDSCNRVLIVRKGWVLDDNGWVYVGKNE